MSAMPPSIAIATLVLGGPGTMRVVLNSFSRHACGPREEGYAAARGRDGTAARARARRRSSCCLNTAANSGPMDTTGLGYCRGSRGRGNSLPRSPRRLTACVIAGCVGHAPVHSDSDPRAWGSGDHARCVEQQQQPPSSRCCSRGRRHRGARAYPYAPPRPQPQLTAAPLVLSGYVRGKG